jgi:hypothetical protein
MRWSSGKGTRSFRDQDETHHPERCEENGSSATASAFADSCHIESDAKKVTKKLKPELWRAWFFFCVWLCFRNWLGRFKIQGRGESIYSSNERRISIPPKRNNILLYFQNSEIRKCSCRQRQGKESLVSFFQAKSRGSKDLCRWTREDNDDCWTTCRYRGILLIVRFRKSFDDEASDDFRRTLGEQINYKLTTSTYSRKTTICHASSL